MDGCMHRVDGAVDSVWCMDVVSSTAIGVDCDWMEDGRVALPAIGVSADGFMREPGGGGDVMRLLESHHLVVPRHQLAVVLEALVLRVWLVM